MLHAPLAYSSVGDAGDRPTTGGPGGTRQAQSQGGSAWGGTAAAVLCASIRAVTAATQPGLVAAARARGHRLMCSCRLTSAGVEAYMRAARSCEAERCAVGRCWCRWPLAADGWKAREVAGRGSRIDNVIAARQEQQTGGRERGRKGPGAEDGGQARAAASRGLAAAGVGRRCDGCRGAAALLAGATGGGRRSLTWPRTRCLQTWRPPPGPPAAAWGRRR